MIFYVIFGDFVGWDWGTPAILQQKHPWKNWIKIWDWQTPPPQLGQKTKFFDRFNLRAPLSQFEQYRQINGKQVPQITLANAHKPPIL